MLTTEHRRAAEGHPYDCQPECLICTYVRREAEYAGKKIRAAFDAAVFYGEKGKMSLTADEYRTAAKVAREEDPEGLKYTIESWEDLAERITQREAKLHALGSMAVRVVQYAGDHLYTGTQLETYLVATGWTPPEALQ